MLSVTVTIADLFEFEGKLPPAERPDDAAIGGMVQRQFRFLPQPINVEIGQKAVTISFNEESPVAKEEAAGSPPRPANGHLLATTARPSRRGNGRLNCSRHFAVPGLHLICLMYAGFKRIAPEHELGMDLNEPFLTALGMFQMGESNP